MTLDKELVEALESDYTTAPITPQERVMVDYVVKLTKDATKVWKDDIEGLRAVGFNDRGILQIIKPRSPQPLNVILTTLGGVLGQLDHIIHHDALLRSDRSSCVILLQRLHQLPIQRHPTQKLCVRLDSILAPVGH